MRDLLLPTTDTGVVAQAVAVALIVIVALWFSRRSNEARIFVIGVGLLAYAAIGLRMLH